MERFNNLVMKALLTHTHARIHTHTHIHRQVGLHVPFNIIVRALLHTRMHTHTHTHTYLHVISGGVFGVLRNLLSVLPVGLTLRREESMDSGLVDVTRRHPGDEDQCFPA